MFDNVRRVFGHSVVYGSADVAIQAVNFLLLPIYTRVLSPAEYGALALLLVLEAFLKPVYRLGLGTSFVRFYYDYTDERSRQTLAATIVILLLGAGVVLLAILLAAAGDLTALVIGSSDYVRAFALLALNLALTSFFLVPFGILRVQERSTTLASITFAVVRDADRPPRAGGRSRARRARDHARRRHRVARAAAGARQPNSRGGDCAFLPRDGARGAPVRLAPVAAGAAAPSDGDERPLHPRVVSPARAGRRVSDRYQHRLAHQALSRRVQDRVDAVRLRPDDAPRRAAAVREACDLRVCRADVLHAGDGGPGGEPGHADDPGGVSRGRDRRAAARARHGDSDDDELRRHLRRGVEAHASLPAGDRGRCGYRRRWAVHPDSPVRYHRRRRRRGPRSTRAGAHPGRPGAARVCDSL